MEGCRRAGIGERLDDHHGVRRVVLNEENVDTVAGLAEYLVIVSLDRPGFKAPRNPSFPRPATYAASSDRFPERAMLDPAWRGDRPAVSGHALPLRQ